MGQHEDEAASERRGGQVAETPIPALDALRSSLRRLHVTENLVTLLTAEIDRAFAVSSVIEGREVYIPLDVLIGVRDKLSAADDREWFWRIVDQNGAADLPSDEGAALRMMINAWRAK